MPVVIRNRTMYAIVRGTVDNFTHHSYSGYLLNLNFNIIKSSY